MDEHRAAKQLSQIGKASRGAVETLTAVRDKTVTSARKRLADWLIDKSLLLISGTFASLVLALVTHFRDILARKFLFPLWQLILFFGAGGALIGGAAVFGVTSYFMNRARLADWQASHIEIQRLKSELRAKTQDANTDDITGIPNSRACTEFLSTEFFKARAQGKPLTVITIDLDDFRLVNARSATLGDTVLRAFAQKLDQLHRRSEGAFRYKPGDEFLLVAPDTSANPGGLAGGVGYANRLRNAFKEDEYRAPDGTYFKLTFCAGIADANPARDSDDTPERLVARAEAARRRAKSRHGKNTFEVYDIKIDEPS